jgi:hypothetical protein
VGDIADIRKEQVFLGGFCMKMFLTKILVANVGIALVGITIGETITGVEAKGIIEISTGDRTGSTLGQKERLGLWERGDDIEEIIHSTASKTHIYGLEKSDSMIGESHARSNARIIAITKETKKPKSPKPPKPK